MNEAYEKLQRFFRAVYSKHPIRWLYDLKPKTYPMCLRMIYNYILSLVLSLFQKNNILH